MANSTAQVKPAKPYPDFPLFPHATKRWAKKIRGKTYYFGPWDDWKGCLEKYKREADYLHSGLQPPTTLDGVTVKDLSNLFLNAKRQLIDNGELSARSWLDYKLTCERVCKAFSKGRLVEDLRPDDFLQLRAALAKGRGPVSLGNEIQRCRCLFKFAFDQELIRTPVRFGQGFKKPSRKVVRQARHRNGLRMLEADQIRTLIDTASPPLKAMILLAMNCAYGQSDLSALPCSAIDLERGWAIFPRVKTGVARRCPLWPETIAALREWLPQCPKAKDRDDAGLYFVTKYGWRWVKVNELTGTPDDAIGKEFSKLLRDKKLKRPGLSFYALRHTFATVASETNDQVAIDSIMGHVDPSVSALYRERVADDRLKRVTDHVHGWLWPSKVAPNKD